MILKNCNFYNESFELQIADIEITDGKISYIGSTDNDGRDMSNYIILPGFVDIHIHGGNGGDASDGTTDALDKMSTYLAKHGVTSYCPTTMTLPIERLCDIARVIASHAPNGAKIAGINFEGPFIAMNKRGAQNGEYVVAGNDDDFDKLYNASNGTMKLITVAPEAFDSDEFIKQCSKKTTVAIGHTSANAEETQRSIANGVSHATHLYNAMTPMAHREAGVVGTALDSNITCELICDTEHICPSVLRNTFKILGEDRAVVISDSMRGAGLGNGEYELGGQMTYVKAGDRVARLEDGTIAASITNMFDEYKNLLAIGVDKKAALKACTINPSKVIKADNEIGSIAIGKCADLIVCDKELNIKEVYINGTLN